MFVVFFPAVCPTLSPLQMSQQECRWRRSAHKRLRLDHKSTHKWTCHRRPRVRMRKACELVRSLSTQAMASPGDAVPKIPHENPRNAPQVEAVPISCCCFDSEDRERPKSCCTVPTRKRPSFGVWPLPKARVASPLSLPVGMDIVLTLLTHQPAR